MEIGQIEAFERAAREGSFTRAAAALGLTQPAISARITTLEAELGGALFERTGRQVALTPLGERFLPHAQRILATIADGWQAVEDFQHGKLGQVKIAAPTPFVLGLLVDVLRAFRDQHPTVDVLVRERPKTAIVDMLRDNTVTLGLVSAPIYAPQFARLLCLRDPIRPVVAPGHPLAGRESLALADLHAHTVYRVSMFPAMTAFMDGLVDDARRGSGGAVIALPMVMAREVARRGEGVAFLPGTFVADDLARGDLVPLDMTDAPDLHIDPVMIALDDRELDDIHREFVRIVKAVWRGLVVGC